MTLEEVTVLAECLKQEPCYKIDSNSISEALVCCQRSISEAPGHHFSRFGTEVITEWRDHILQRAD